MDQHQKPDLSTFSNKGFDHGGSFIKRVLWFIINPILVRNPIILSSHFKKAMLRAFGAQLGKGVVIKQGIIVKYPWRLQVGDYSWIGENVWIDNLVDVTIESHCCISQGAMLLTGNHDYTKSSFDLIVGKIHLKTGVWIGAKSIVCPGVICDEYSVLAVGSVATSHLKREMIYQGNPATEKRMRW